jgi:hypothetical protein
MNPTGCVGSSVGIVYGTSAVDGENRCGAFILFLTKV